MLLRFEVHKCPFNAIKRTSFPVLSQVFEVQNMLSMLRDILSRLLSAAIWKGKSGAKSNSQSKTHSGRRVPMFAHYRASTLP